MLGSFGVYSSKNLTETEANIFISILVEKVKYKSLNVYKKHDDFAGRDSKMATPAQLRILEAILGEIKSS